MASFFLLGGKTMNPLLNPGMHIYAGEFKGEDRREGKRYYLIRFVAHRGSSRGGFCKEAAEFISTLGIPTTSHWDNSVRVLGWKASYYIEVTTSDTPMNHKVNPIIREHCGEVLTNYQVAHLLTQQSVK